MTRTLAAKVIEGIHSQRWTVSGYGGTWAGAMRPLEEYVKRRVEKVVAAEREACALVCEAQLDEPASQEWNAAAKCCADAIRARGNT